MKKAIIFCNLHANGDIIWSRQGVRWVVDQLGDKFVYFYVHTKHKDICFIHEKVNVITIPQNFHGFPMKRVKDQFNLDMFEDALWVDVWAASFEKMQRVDCGEDGVRFKLPDEFGNYHADCEEIQDSPTWQQKLYSEKIGSINEFLATNFSTKRLEVPDSKEFICKWNSNPKHKFFADIFLKRTKKFDLRVMICNGNTTSSQRRNFIYEDILRDYILNNPNICFYLTSKINEIEADNVFYMDDNFPIPNMDEIEYIMKSCDIIVTSQSGPGCLVFADEIVFDENRTLINFCVDRVDWYFDGGTCEYIRTSNFEDENVYNLITQNIEKKLSKK